MGMPAGGVTVFAVTPLQRLFRCGYPGGAAVPRRGGFGGRRARAGSVPGPGR